jgi:predicted helicase
MFNCRSNNLNIEYTYSQKMEQYAEFKNICFVDTLDNLGFTSAKKYTEAGSLDFGGFSPENLERIKRQNRRKISVIIGNPPYNANQLNENENNKNRPYPGVDKRIKDTYVAESTAQKTKLYDMYARFIRWASDRLDKNGVIAFVSNNSFINAKTYDGFRKVVAKEFNEIYIIDMKGDARTSGERRRCEGGNVFSDQIRVGVAVYFLIRKDKVKGCKIFYNGIGDYLPSETKKAYLRDNRIQDLPFDHIRPDKNHNWINLNENEWDGLLPVASKDVKLSKGKIDEKAIFKLFSLGVITARDEWVYDEKDANLEGKIQFLIEVYNREVERLSGKITRSEVEDNVDYSIKWTRAVKNDLAKGKQYIFKKKCIIGSLYRPFVQKKLYFSHELNEMQYQLPTIFPNPESENIAITFSGTGSSKPFSVLVVNIGFSHDFLEKTQCLPLYRYDKEGQRGDNITDWTLKQFQSHYRDKTITRPDIFRYVYAVLHDPAYREKYRLNLKREFPRIPFYDDYRKWADWGKRLMEQHLGYEKANLYPLKRIDKKPEPGKPPVIVKPILKADKATGVIHLDSATILKGVPPEAWEYRLGNRCAIEWVLEYHKERKPKDPTIREKFDAYRFADHKEQVIDLLQRVCKVSVETIKIIREMTQKINV